MTAYQQMNTDAPTVLKHGSTFNEAEDLQQQYPFQLCPECMSEHTEVVKHLRSDYGPGTYTGAKHLIRKVIFDHQYERVNYICKDCSYEFYQLYRTGVKESIGVDADIAWAVIGSSMTALSLFMFITSLLIYDPPAWVIIIALLSIMLVVFFGAATCAALAEIFG